MKTEKNKARHKVYNKSSWSWFYKNFIHKTVNDNFYTPAEILQRHGKIIERVEEYEMKREQGLGENRI